MTGPANFKKLPWRSEKYRRFVASLPCVVCGRLDCNAHHENLPGQSTMASKCCDSRTLPLCCGHHSMLHFVGKVKWADWGVDPEQVITATQERWYERYKTRPWMG